MSKSQRESWKESDAELFRLLVESVTDYAIFILDPQGNVATWNPGAERIKQYKADEIIGQHFSTFYTQDDMERGWPAHELKIALTEGHFEDEGWRVRKDGSQFWANVVIAVLRDEAGNFRGFSKITRDLTQRRRANENARRLVEETTARRVAEDSAWLIQDQRERLHVTLASIGDAVITTNAEGRITFVNSVAENLTGWKLEEASLRNLDDVFCIINEATRHSVESPALRALKEGVIVGLANHTLLISKDGTERPIDDSAAPIRDATGSVIGCVLVFRDVTESRRAAQEIRIVEARKSAILESALDCIITMDHEGKVVEFNPAAEKTFGYSRGVVVGRDLADFIIPPSLRERHHRGMAHYLATGEGPVLGKRLELPALREDGTEFPVELAITRIPTDGPPLFTAYLRDISEQKRAEQHRSARLAVTHVLSEAASVEDGASGVLQAVCENLGWDVGFFWTVNEAGTALVCMKSWHRPEVAVQAFETTSCSRTFEKGEGLPGRVWASGKRVWILDVMQDGNFPRLAFAARHDLHSAFGCPIVVGDRTLGVIEFFTKRLREPDNDLLEMMGTVAGSVGQFLERKSAEAALLDAHGQLEDRVAERTAELVRANEFLDALLENVQTGVVACDPAGVLTLFNGVTRALHGLPEEPIPPEQWAERYRLYRPDGETPMAKEDVPLYRALQGERVQDAEMVIAPLGVPPRTVQVSGQAFHDDQGTKLGAVVSMQDITARKHAEVELRQAHEELERRVEERTEQLGRANAALRESEEKLRLLADTIPQLAWMARPDGHIFWYNRRWYEYTGTTPEQMAGWGWQSVHDPDVLPKVVERWNRSITTGEPFDMVFPLKAADGQYHPFLTRVNPLRDETGSILYWFGTNTDITELRQTREALVTSEERLRLALDAGRMGVWDWNIRTGELKWSDSLEPLHGLAHGTFGGTFDHFQQLIHSEDREMVTAAIQQALESGGEFYIEFRNVWSNGGIHWIAGSGKVFPGDDGQPLRMIGIGLDVTQRKRTEQTARFLADASAALAVLVDFDSTLQKVASLAVPSFAEIISSTPAASAISSGRGENYGESHLLRRFQASQPPMGADLFGVLLHIGQFEHRDRVSDIGVCDECIGFIHHRRKHRRTVRILNSIVT